jgi:SulP family sulfate permease
MTKILLKRIKENWKSGLTVSLVSIPLAISLAVASNATPLAGIITAVWGGLAASIFGGSNYNVIGPTGALSGLLAAYALVYGASSLPTIAIFTGLFILVAYFFKLERYLIYFPASTLHGFTLGVAIIIILNQINYACGLLKLPIHERFLGNVFESLKHLPEISWVTVTCFLFFLIALFILVRLMPKIPSAIILAPIAIALGYISTTQNFIFSIQTLESKYPDLSLSLFMFPSFRFSYALLVPAITIAIIAILETMISARIADGITRTKHNKRKEMLGLSFANIASGVAGGIPATAALARTALNIKTGCTNKISATISSIFIALISIVLLRFFKYIPLAAIAAMLVFVSIKMIEHEHFIRMFRIDKKNFFLSIGVAIVTVLEDPIVGILLGATVAMLMFMERASRGFFDITTSEEYLQESKGESKIETLESIDHQGSNALIYTIKGQLAYINAQSHLARFEEQKVERDTVIFNLKELYFIDHDGIEIFGEIIELLHKQGKLVLVTGVSQFVKNQLEESKTFVELQNNGHVFTTISHALFYLLSSSQKKSSYV